VLITLEGCDGSGKSTQTALLKSRLEECHPKLKVALTREPGGTALGQEITRIVKAAGANGLVARAELLLFAADRAQHVEEKLRPLLADDWVVISDRYADSTLAYQGYGRGLDLVLVRQVLEVAVAGLWPDFTVLLDVPPEVAAERQQAGPTDRIEQEQAGFHRRVREGFLTIAAEEPERVFLVDGTRSPDLVSEDVLSLVEPMLYIHEGGRLL
jgi:dTMP kinase